MWKEPGAAGGCVAGGGFVTVCRGRLRGTTLRIGMTAADIPRTLASRPGFRGQPLHRLTMFDALTMWTVLVREGERRDPGLATGWKVDESDKTKWTFKLRSGVSFHDGSPFNADAVVWNVDKVLKQDAPQFDPSQVGVTASRMPTCLGAQDRRHDGGTDHQGAGQFSADQSLQSVHGQPFEMAEAFRRRRRRRRQGEIAGRWAAFARDASGTGPWKMSSFTPRERLELVKNDKYWTRSASQGRQDAAAADAGGQCPHAALLSGRSTGSRRRRRTRWRKSSSAASSSIPTRSACLAWQFSRSKARPGTTFGRKAANLCIDRED